MHMRLFPFADQSPSGASTRAPRTVRGKVAVRTPNQGMSQNFARPAQPVAMVRAGSTPKAKATHAAQLTYTCSTACVAHQHCTYHPLVDRCRKARCTCSHI